MEHRLYAPDARPDIQVLVDGVWCEGELRMWSQRDDGSSEADVQWRLNGEPTRRLDTFAADQIRLVEKAPTGPGPRGRFPISGDDSFDRRSLESE